MQENSLIYVWRCAKCSCHFTNIYQASGVLKQEKKCSKCKSLNILTLTDKEIFINCKLFDQRSNEYYREVEENFNYPMI